MQSQRRSLSSIGAKELLAAFNSGELTCAVYTEHVISAHEANAAINAFQTFSAGDLRKDAVAADTLLKKGRAKPMTGLPIAVKDNINTKDFCTSAGTAALLHSTPKTDAPMVAALRRQGAIVAGKTGMHELAFGITSNNATTGAIRNPHDHSRIAGGSSGGTAAAVAAGIVPIGLGTDTGGSCRIPAALCGIVGFRPTTGRYPNGGVVPISHTRDTVGILARKVEDISFTDNLLTGENPRKPVPLSGIKIGVPKEFFFDGLEPEVAASVDAALKLIEKAGAKLVDVGFKTIWPHNQAFGFPVVLYEVMRDLPAYLKRFAPKISLDSLIEKIASPDVAGAFASQRGEGAVPRNVYLEALKIHRPKMRAIYKKVFADAGISAIAFPTTPLRASKIGEDETVMLNGAKVPTFMTYIRNTDLGSNLGAPGISLPCPVGSALPVGIELDGLPGQDRKLLMLAQQIEQLLNT